MIWGGLNRIDLQNNDFRVHFKQETTSNLKDRRRFHPIKHPQVTSLVHIIRRPNDTITKKLTFENNHNIKTSPKLKVDFKNYF